MKVWFQPVQFKSGPIGQPRRVHLRRVELAETLTPEGPSLSVVSVSPRTLCNASNIIRANAEATCPQCLRLAENETRQRKEQ